MFERVMVFFRKDGSLDLFKVGNVLALLLVSLLLISNLIALFLSFPIVFEGSPEEYTSGIKGSLPLPYIIDSNTEGIEVDYEILNEGYGPLMISVMLPDGNIPSMPLSVQLPIGNGELEHFLLHDTFLENGSWRGITVIPHKLQEGDLRPELYYKTSGGSIRTGYILDEISIDDSHYQHVEIGCTSSLEVKDELSIIIEGQISQDIDAIEIDKRGRSHQVVPKRAAETTAQPSSRQGVMGDG